MTTQRNGRATACKQSAPQKVHRWTDLILAGELPEGIAGCLFAILAGLTFTGILPLLLAAFLIWLFDPIPSWIFIAGFCVMLLAIAAWLWRTA